MFLLVDNGLLSEAASRRGLQSGSYKPTIALFGSWLLHFNGFAARRLICA